MNKNSESYQKWITFKDGMKAKMKGLPLKYKIGLVLFIALALYIWGIFTQVAAVFINAEFIPPDLSPLVAYPSIVTRGAAASMVGLIFILIIILAICLYYYRNHINVPETYTIHRNGKEIIVVKDDGTLSTGHEAFIEDLEEGYILTSRPDMYSEPIFGTNLYDNRYVLCLKKQVNDIQNSIIFGGAGSRKTRGIIMPLIDQLAKAHKNMVITDPSGEICAKAGRVLQKENYRIKVINTRNPLKSNGWNFIGDIGTDFALAQIFSTTIIDATNSENAKKDMFWEEEMKNLLTALIILINYRAQQKGQKGNLKQLIDKVSSTSLVELKAEFETLPSYDPAVKSFLTFYDNPEKVRSQVKNNLGIRLQPFFEPCMAEMLSTDDIHISDFIAEPDDMHTALFIITSEQDTTYSMIGGLFLDASFKTFSDVVANSDSEVLPNPVHYIFDEFANIGHIQNMGQKLSVSRKYGLVVHMVLQSLPQFYARYDENEVHEIISNCHSILILSCAENITAEFFSALFGEMTVLTYQVTTNSPIIRDTASVRSTLQKRPIYLPGEILDLKKDHFLLWSKDCPVVELEKIDYSALAEFKEIFAQYGGEKESLFSLEELNFNIVDPRVEIRNIKEQNLQAETKTNNQSVPSSNYNPYSLNQTNILNPQNNTNQNAKKPVVGIYNTDCTPKFEFPDSQNRNNPNDKQLHLDLSQDSDSLNDINKLPEIKPYVKWDSHVNPIFNGLIKQAGTRRVFNCPDYPDIDGKKVVVLYFASNSPSLNSLLPAPQIRCAGEQIDVNNMTSMITKYINLPTKYYIDFWSMVNNRNGKKDKTKRIECNSIISVPTYNCTLIPHLSKKKRED